MLFAPTPDLLCARITQWYCILVLGPLPIDAYVMEGPISFITLYTDNYIQCSYD